MTWPRSWPCWAPGSRHRLNGSGSPPRARTSGAAGRSTSSPPGALIAPGEPPPRTPAAIPPEPARRPRIGAGGTLASNGCALRHIARRRPVCPGACLPRSRPRTPADIIGRAIPGRCTPRWIATRCGRSGGVRLQAASMRMKKSARSVRSTSSSASSNRSEATRKALGVTLDQLTGEWSPDAPNAVCLNVARAARDAGAEGFVVPSAARAGGWNVAVLPSAFDRVIVMRQVRSHPAPATE